MQSDRIAAFRPWISASPIATMIAAMLVAGGCASVQAAGSRAAMPTELTGIWDVVAASCTGQGNPDSDTRLIIRPSGIDNYEQTFVPIETIDVSDAPRAWKIHSTLRFEGESSDHRALYVLARDGRLTIVDDSRTDTYARCR